VNAGLYPEINQPLPRRVGIGFKPILVAAIVAVVRGIIAYLAVGIDLGKGWKNEILKARGVVTQGSIEELRVSYERHSTTYQVDYLFVPSSNSPPQSTIKGTTVVRHDEFFSLKRGQSVPVIYDPQDIQRSSLAVSDNPDRPELTGGLPKNQKAGFLLASASSSRSGLMAESRVPFCTVGATSTPVTASNTAVSGLKA
jgi:uncharacterized protein DUF3592